MAAPRHIIKRQIIEVEVPSVEGAWELQNRFSELYKYELLRILEEEFDMLSEPGEVLRIDKLEIDIGQVTTASFEDDVKNELQKKIREKIQELKQKASGGGTVLPGETIPRTKAARYTQADFFLYFLRTGTAPWWYSRDTFGTFAEVAQKLIGEKEKWLRGALRALPADKKILRRLVMHLDDASLEKLVALFSHSLSEGASSVVVSIRGKLARVNAIAPSLPAATFRSLFWEALVQYAATSQKEALQSLFSQNEIAAAAVFSIEKEKENAVVHFISANGITLPRETDNAFVELLNEEYAKPGSGKKKVRRLVRKKRVDGKTVLQNEEVIPGDEDVVPGKDKAVVSEESVITGEENDERINGPGEEAGSGKKAGKKRRLKRKKNASAEKQDANEQQEMHDDFTEAEAAGETLIRQPGEEDEGEVVLENDEKRAGSEHDVPGKNELHTEKEVAAGEEYEEEEEYYYETEEEDAADFIIQNAGLVLLWPYLNPFFSGLALVENNKFVSEAAAHRAVHLLQYMVDGGAFEYEEHDLVFNKLLCGLEITEVIDMHFEITDNEREEVKGLIEAVIANWKVIGNTSVDGFRSSFLQKEGSLLNTDTGWKLYIERSAIDLLLDRLPWSVSILRLPWSETTIFVEW